MTNEIFFDDFGNLNNWINFGSPRPYTKNSKYYVNGDGSYASGSYSKQRFKIKNGMCLEFRALQAPGNIWDMFYHIGFGKNYNYSDRHIPYSITIGIYGHNPDRNMKVNNAIICRAGDNQRTIPGLNDGAPHTYKIEFEDNNILFYRDDNLLYRCPNPYIGQELPLLIAGRSVHRSNWIEYIKIYEKNSKSASANTNTVKITSGDSDGSTSILLGIIIILSLVAIGYYAYKKGYFGKILGNQTNPQTSQ